MRCWRRLRAARALRDARGVTIIEFALVSPVMLLLMMGLGELCYQGYLQSVLTGAIQKAGRDSTIQGASQSTTTIDTAIMTVMWQVAARATYTSSRKSYSQFGYIAPEPFTDSNKNGVHDTHECFTDVNGNGVWDADPGITGQGGANDVTVYTITITYPRLFPIGAMVGWGSTKTLTATTILKNQPYASQSVPTATAICP